MVITVCSKPGVQWVAPPAGRPDVGTWLPFLFRATPVAEPDGRSLRSKANNCRGRAFRRHARQVPRRYEPLGRRASHPPSGQSVAVAIGEQVQPTVLDVDHQAGVRGARRNDVDASDTAL